MHDRRRKMKISKMLIQDLITMHHEKEMSIQEIAEHYCLTYQAVRQFMKKNNIEVNKAKSRKPMPREYQCNEEYFDVIDAEEKAYWLGYIVADGGLVQVKKDRPNQLRLAFNIMASDIIQLEKLCESLKCNTPIKVIMTKENSLTTYSGKEITIQPKEQAILQINSSRLCKGLMEQGVSLRKSLQEKPPTIKRELIRHFLRGYFDGDGCFSIKNPTNRNNSYIGVYIASGEELATWIVKVVYEEIGVKISIHKQGKLYKAVIQNREGTEAFMNWIYRDAIVYLNRKYEAYQKYLAKI